MGREADLEGLDITYGTRQNIVARFGAVRQIFPQISAIVTPNSGSHTLFLTSWK